MKMFVLMIAVLLSGSAFAGGYQGDLSDDNIGYFGHESLPFNYVVDRKHQMCFMAFSDYVADGKGSITVVDCEKLRASAEIDKFLKSGSKL